MISRKSFTLLEVLIAGGILFVVSASVVGLSNSIIRGTTIVNDATITNRWATEGLELVTKIRDERSELLGFASGEGIWFGDPADPISNYAANTNYGWHYLKSDVSQLRWWLEPIEKSLQYSIDLTNLDPSTNFPKGVELVSGNLVGYRLICVESFGAVSGADQNRLSCNRDQYGTEIYDGDRLQKQVCDDKDLYCVLSMPSLQQVNKEIIIPDGNAVKVRSAVLWGDRGKFATTDIATVLTNWRSIAN